MALPTLLLAFVAGLFSFLSPCILPVLPGFLAYLAGSDTAARKDRWGLFIQTVFFVLGFSLVFALFGVLLNGALSRLGHAAAQWLSWIGGTLIIVFSLQVLDIIDLPFLSADPALGDKIRFKARWLSAFVFGAAFAVGWSPCVSALLGSVFALAIASPGQAFPLLLAYGLGLGVPFLLLGLFTERILSILRRYRRAFHVLRLAVGVLLLLIGILVFTGNLAVLGMYLPSWVIA